MIAILAILTIFAFVLFPSLLQLMGSGSSGNPVVATSKYGTLHAMDMQRMREDQSSVLRVFDGIAQALYQKGQAQAARDLSQFAGMLRPHGDEDLVDSWLLAQQAKELGFVAGAEAVNQFLRAATTEQLTNEELHNVFENARLSDQRVFEMLGDLLLSVNMRQMMQTSLFIHSPEERWGFFLRLNRKATIEAVPVKATEFLSAAAAPTDSQLAAFYEERKNTLNLPYEAEIGFREPKRIAVRYFDADMIAIAKDAITDEMVREEYETNKAEYDRPAPGAAAQRAAQGLTDPKGLFQGALGAPPPPPEATSTATSSGTATGAATSATPPAADATPPQPPANQPPAEASNKETPPPTGAGGSASADKSGSDSTGEKSSPSPAPRESSPTDKAATDHQGASAARPSPFHWAAYQADVKAPAGTAANGGESAPAADHASPAAKTDDANHVPSAAATETSAAAAAASEPQPSAAQPSGSNPGVSAPADAKPAESKTDESQAAAGKQGLTDALKQQIRDRLAAKKVTEVFAQLKAAIDQFRRDRVLNVGAAGKSTSVTEPDWQALASEHHLKLGETGLVGQWQVEQTPILKAITLNSQPPGQPLGNVAFGPWADFTPYEAFDLKSHRFLAWKTDSVEEHTPKLDDPGMRDRVAGAFKLIEARKRAFQTAEQLAAAARDSNKPLAAIFAQQPDRPVISPEPFTWMTRSDLPAFMGPTQASVTDVEQIPLAGDEFMRGVFSLSAGQSGVARNEPQTIAYVVHVKEFSPAFETLWDRFKTERYELYATAGANDRREFVKDWFKSIRKAANLVWREKPAATTDRGDEEE